MKISLVIPAFNEERRLPATLEKVAAHVAASGEKWEIIVADDGSRDRTSDVARAEGSRLELPLRVVRLPENRGKGAALRAGVLASSGDFVLISDADLSTPIEEWRKLAAAGTPVAIGSRALDTNLVKKRQPLHRVWGGRLMNRVIQLLAVPGIRDTQCGFKWIEGKAAREMFGVARIDRFAYDVEILFLARRRGLAITEVPVLWFNSEDSRVSVVRDSTRLLWDLFRIRFGRVGNPESRRAP